MLDALLPAVEKFNSLARREDKSRALHWLEVATNAAEQGAMETKHMKV